MKTVTEACFEVERKPDGVFVGHLPSQELGGLAITELLETAAPVKAQDVTEAIDMVVSQFGFNGVFEAMNSKILKAHRLAFGEAWSRAFISAQLIRFCVEPLTRSPSMYGATMRFPYDWCHRSDEDFQSEEELHAYLKDHNQASGVSADDQLQARALGFIYGEYNASEWIQLRTGSIDAPINLRLPGSTRGYEIRAVQPPVIEPKLCWREENGKRIPIGNAEAGLVTKSEPDRMVYRDGTTGLVFAATQLGVCDSWPKEYGFSGSHLPKESVTKGVIKMESPQVPLLAQVSASSILNHPGFETLIERS